MSRAEATFPVIVIKQTGGWTKSIEIDGVQLPITTITRAQVTLLPSMESEVTVTFIGRVTIEETGND